jgi:hypothetical protein
MAPKHASNYRDKDHLHINYREDAGAFPHPISIGGAYRGFVNRSAIELGVWRFVEGGEHGGAIRDGGSTSLPSFRSRNGGEILRAAIIHYMATSARLQ